MGKLPASVRDVIEITLPRPRRREETLRDARAIQIKQQALDILHAEAMQSLHLLARRDV